MSRGVQRNVLYCRFSWNHSKPQKIFGAIDKKDIKLSLITRNEHNF